MKTMIKSEVKEISWPQKTFLTIRTRLPFDKLADFFKESYGKLYSTIALKGISSNEPPCAIYYTIDEVQKQTEFAAAVPVSGSIDEIKDFEKVVIPTSKVITIRHHGSYDNMTSSYALLEKYMTEHGLKRKWIIEEYLSDPAVEKDPANWETNIYYVVE